jgi:hypothetical protein
MRRSLLHLPSRAILTQVFARSFSKPAAACFKGQATLVTAALLLVPSAALAQQGIIRGGIPGCNFSTGAITAGCIPSFIAHLVQFIFMLIGIFFLMSIMFAGYQIAIASARGQDRSTGYNRLIWSIIGFLVAACSFVIMNVVLSVILGT